MWESWTPEMDRAEEEAEGQEGPVAGGGGSGALEIMRVSAGWTVDLALGRCLEFYGQFPFLPAMLLWVRACGGRGGSGAPRGHAGECAALLRMRACHMVPRRWWWWWGQHCL